MLVQGQTEEVDILNRKIGAEYVTIDGHKIFRLVWSESVFENRYGTFREFTEGGLFIREVTETRRTRKYNYIHNRWIFEMWAPGSMVANRETPDAANGDYVPVYVFEDRGGNYLPPNEKVVRFLIGAVYGKVRKDEIPSQEYLEEREIAGAIESMDDHPAWFQTRPGPARNAIWYAGGVPKWHERRATWDEGDFVQRAALKAMEDEARDRRRRVAEAEQLEALTAARREREAIKEREIMQERAENEQRRQAILQEQEAERQFIREQRAEAARDLELQREQEMAEMPQEKAVVKTESPMH